MFCLTARAASPETCRSDCGRPSDALLAWQSRTLEGGATEPLWSRRHPDISTAPTDGNLNLCKPEWYGFGSVHYPRDLGCIAALTFAMTKKEAVGQVGWQAASQPHHSRPRGHAD